MSAPNFFDVVVVGTGPAGCSAALTLSRAGLRVAVFEKAQLPRYKTCGGGVLARALKFLPANVRTVIESECYSAELHHHGPNLSYSTRRDTPIVSMVMRDRFDHWLTLAAEQCGATIFAQTAVLDLDVSPERVALSTTAGEFNADFVIAADGVMSVVARKCGFPELRQVIPALECEIKVDRQRFDRFSLAARFDFGLTPFGYGWVFPKQEHLSVGVLTTHRGCCNLNDEYQRYVTALGLGDPIDEQRHGYMIPTRPRDGLFKLSRVLLVGDAAGLADPVTAEGISNALLSGQLAATAVIQNPAKAQRVIEAYRTSLRTTLLRELSVARVLARGLYNFPKVRAWAFARHGQRLSEFVTNVVIGDASYREAMCRPKNYLKLLARGRGAGQSRAAT